jgi:hypothetical protein
MAQSGVDKKSPSKDIAGPPRLKWSVAILKALVELRTSNVEIVRLLHEGKKRSHLTKGWELLAKELTKRINDDSLWDSQTPRTLTADQVGL